MIATFPSIILHSCKHYTINQLDLPILKKISRKYNVSYDQVYNWVKKFKELGEAGLEDRRGKRTEDQVPRTAEEEMKIRIAQLEHELYMTKLERDLLKKLDELERRDASHK